MENSRHIREIKVYKKETDTKTAICMMVLVEKTPEPEPVNWTCGFGNIENAELFEGIKSFVETFYSEIKQQGNPPSTTREQAVDKWDKLIDALKENGYEIESQMREVTMNLILDGRRGTSTATGQWHEGNSEGELDAKDSIAREIQRRISGVPQHIAEEAAKRIKETIAEEKNPDAVIEAIQADIFQTALFWTNAKVLYDVLADIDVALYSKEQRKIILDARLSAASNCGKYSLIEKDIRDYLSEFSDEIDSKLFLALKTMLGDSVAQQGKGEIANAIYRDVLKTPELPAESRANCHSGIARIHDSCSEEMIRHNKLAGDAFVEANEKSRAIGCYMECASCLQSTKPQESLALAENCLDLTGEDSPDSASIRRFIADTLFKLGKFKEAKNEALTAASILRRTLGLEVDYSGALAMAAVAARNEGEEKEAEEIEQQVADWESSVDNDELKLLHRIMNYLENSEAEDVNALRADVETFNKSYATVTLKIVEGVKAKNDNPIESLDHLETAKKELRKLERGRRMHILPLVHFIMAQCCERLGIPDKTKEHFRKAYELDPYDNSARNHYLDFLIKQNYWTELVEILEQERKRWGDLPGILWFLGRAHYECGSYDTASKILYQAKKKFSEKGDVPEFVEEYLDRAMENRKESTTLNLNEAEKVSSIGLKELGNELTSFADYIKKNVRKEFWRQESGKEKKWVEKPERVAQRLLNVFLGGKFGHEVVVMEELETGAGRMDLFVDLKNGPNFIVELKMCGRPYSLNYAKEGFKQLRHYMENKETGIGFLIVFDARKRDFGKGIPTIKSVEEGVINSIFVDVRPEIV